MGNEVMPLNKAMYILADIHTSEDDQVGFVVHPGGSHRHSRWAWGDYTEAWKSVRHNCGMSVDTALERTETAQIERHQPTPAENETGAKA